MSDLFGNHIVGFPMRRLIYLLVAPACSFASVVLVMFSLGGCYLDGYLAGKELVILLFI